MLVLTIGTRYKVEAPTVLELRDVYVLLRDHSGEGASTWPEGKIQSKESNLAALRVSYNGRVWNGKIEVQF